MHGRRLNAKSWLQARNVAASNGSTNRQTHYDTLGVSSDASVARIKAAFREKAKRHHPDKQPGTGQGEWIQILTAYQVLTDARSRELYDLSRAAGVPPLMRKAAAAGGGGGSEEQEVDLAWGRGFLRRPREASSSTMLDRLRGELDSDLHAALRHAFVGPRLAGLHAGQLPACFEADERSTPDSPDVLQLVSGRQLLGVVRQWQPQLLSPEERQRRLVDLGVVVGHIQPSPSPAVPRQNAPGREQQPPPVAAGECRQRPHPQARPSCDDAPGGDDFELLEMVIGGEVTAAAVRSSAAAEPTPAHPSSSGGTSDQEVPSERDSSGCSSSSASIRFYLDGRYAAELRTAHEAATAHTASAARLNDSAGRHTHSVLRSATPLVRHITFVSELREISQPPPGRQRLRTRGVGPAIGNSGSTPAVVARCRRAWLPPSSLWPFPPRSYHHDIGGYYIEWVGHATEGRHPAWLHPAVIALTAAFDTLDNERAARQPHGLFSRLSRGEETAGGVAAWVKAMLRFHRRG